MNRREQEAGGRNQAEGGKIVAPLLRVVVTGSESTGKTTLAAQLAAHYGAPLVPEFARTLVARLGRPIDARDHDMLAQGQIAAEDAAIAQATHEGRPLLVYDTDLLSTVTYCHHYTGQCLAHIEAAARARRADLYLLLDIDVPWVADGVRDRGDRRDEVHALFVETLTRLGAPCVVIHGTWAQRFAAACAHVDRLLRSR